MSWTSVDKCDAAILGGVKILLASILVPIIGAFAFIGYLKLQGVDCRAKNS